MKHNIIQIRGAREHNLKNVDVDIPKNRLVVITGLSGSGKSSLAFDTIYAEGHRRYVESLSTYARKFLGLMDKPEVDSIEGLSPAISIDQRSGSNNPRSTVGTITEIYDHLRLLFARVGRMHCYRCGKAVSRARTSEIIEHISGLKDRAKTVLAPVVMNQKGEHKKVLSEIKNASFLQVRIDGQLHNLSELSAGGLDAKAAHRIEGVVGPGTATRDALSRLVELALDLGNGQLIVLDTAGRERQFSQYYH